MASTPKKRKLEPGGGTQAMSAFALRRKFLQDKASSSAPGETGLPPQDQVAPAPQSARKTRYNSSKSKSTENEEDATSRQGVSAPKSQIRENDGNDAEVRSRVVQHSSFKPTRKNLTRKGDGTLVLKLPDGERLVVLGSYGVKICSGEATIGGATLRPSDQISWVHSPHCHALPVLRCSDETTLELCPHPAAQSLRSLGELSPTFARLWNEPHQDARKRQGDETFQIVYTSADAPKRAFLQELKAPAEWNKKIASLVSAKNSKPQVLLICGPKSSGKSTFARLLTNRFTTHDTRPKNGTNAGVAILDIDPGQPEFGPPGIVSLVHVDSPTLSPPFCHPNGPSKQLDSIKSHAICAVTPAMDPAHFTECVLDLYAEYKLKLAHKCPLIINTPGWVQGTGLDILVGLVQELQPTEIVYMSKDGPEETVEGLNLACRKAKSSNLSTLPSQATEFTSRTALHLRTMQMLSYFHLDAEMANEKHVLWNTRPLTASTPLVVPFTGPARGICGIVCYDYQPSTELLAEFLNGTIVALVEVEDMAAFSRVHTSGLGKAAGTGYEYEAQEGLPLIRNETGRTLDPRFSRALGLGLIRGIDMENGCIHLLTPVSLDKIQEVHQNRRPIVLVAGKFDPPSWAYTEDLYSQAYDSNAKDDGEGGVEITDEDTDDDSSENNDEEETMSPHDLRVPWVEMLHGNQKRAVGSRVWRVRRDLGKGANE